MTVVVKRVRSASETFSLLESLSNKNVRFRGQRDATWKLESTLARHFRAPPSNATTLRIDGMIDQFVVNLISIGIKLPFALNDRRARLEFARHYGVPWPLIDFSHSPYVALFFAFDRVRPNDASTRDYAAIYCLDMIQLAGIWAGRVSAGIDVRVEGKKYTEENNKFLYEEGALFKLGYPHGLLKYIEMPASWNRRMQRQLGVFLYDTLDYKLLGFDGLEEFMTKSKETPGELENVPVMTKVLIPHKIGREVFERLEIMCISGTTLFEDHSGAATDVINSYNYGRKTGRAWDVTYKTT